MNVQFINPFLEATIDVLQKMAFVKVNSKKPFLKDSLLSYGAVSGIIGMAGEKVQGTMVVSFNQSAILRVVSNMLGEQFLKVDEVIVDLTKNDPNDRAQIRYVPTPADIAQEMIALARVTKDDVVYEPGCGDARIVLAAVKAGARKGVGIDIDPERVAESTANVNAENLEGKIEIRLADALEVDLSEATIVFLYMGNEFNLLIRPILWKQLPVGARVVSHRFTMGDWKPDQTAYVTGSGDELEYELHLWTITEAIKAQIEKASGF